MISTVNFGLANFGDSTHARHGVDPGRSSGANDLIFILQITLRCFTRIRLITIANPIGSSLKIRIIQSIQRQRQHAVFLSH